MAANSRTAVATHIMVSLALKEDTVTSSYLAESVNTNPVVVRRILGDLQKAGLVVTTSGKTGGAQLAKTPQSISLQDIFHAVDGGSLFALNPNEANNECPISRVMCSVLAPIFESADQALAAHLKRTRLADIVKAIRTRAKLK